MTHANQSQKTRRQVSAKPDFRQVAFDAADVACSRARDYAKATEEALNEAREAFEQALKNSATDPVTGDRAYRRLRLAHLEHKAASLVWSSAISTRQLALSCVLQRQS